MEQNNRNALSNSNENSSTFHSLKHRINYVSSLYTLSQMNLKKKKHNLMTISLVKAIG